MIREIAARLGVQVDGKEQVQALMGTLDGAKSKLQTFAKLLMAGAATHFIKEQIEAADNLGDTAERLGITTDALQEFQYALKLTGGEVEGAEKAIFLLTKALGAAAEGGDGAKAFNEFGIEVRDANGHIKGALDILPDVADAVAKAKSPAEQTAIAMKFFGKSGLGMLPMLKRGREGVKELSAEFKDLGGGISKEVIEGASGVSDQMDRFRFVSKVLASQLISLLMPALTVIMKLAVTAIARFNAFTKSTNILRYAFVALGIAMGIKFAPQLLSTVKQVWSSIRAFSALRTSLFGVQVPLMLVVGTFLLLFLVFEDLYQLMQGNESLIGDLLDGMGDAESKTKIIGALRQAWDDVSKAIEEVKPTLKEIWKELAAGATGAVPMLAAAFVGLVKGVAAGVASLSGLAHIISKLANKDYAGAIAEANKTADTIFGKSQSMKTIDGAGNVKEVKENVGGLFGISAAEYDKKLVAQGFAPANVQASTNIVVNVPPGTPASVSTAVTDGVSKGIGNTWADAHAALATSAPGK